MQRLFGRRNDRHLMYERFKLRNSLCGVRRFAQERVDVVEQRHATDGAILDLSP